MFHNVLVIVVLLNGLLAGTFLGSSLVEHSARVLNGPDWLAYKQAKEAVFGPVMPVFFVIVFISSLLIAVLGPQKQAFGITSALLFVALVITVVVHLPLNKQFQGWSTGCLPSGWDRARRRWRNWNWARSACAIAAFTAAVSPIAS